MDQNIFISYRRGDTDGYEAGIYDRLQARFGVDRVFMDVTNIGVGENFSDAINQAIGSCKVVIVLIGPRWHLITDEMGRKRLDDPHDFVRLEIQAALDRDVLIVPVLVHGGKMPDSGELPYELRALISFNAIKIRHRRFDSDVEYLVVELERFLGENEDRDLDPQNRKPTRWFVKLGWIALALMIFGVIFPFIWLRNDEDIPIVSVKPKVTMGIESAGTAILPTQAIIQSSPTETVAASLSASTTPTTTNTPTLTSTPAPTLTPTDAFLQTQILDPFGFSMILVPQGPFTMGTDDREPWDLVARPARLVGLDMFYIDRYEVSNSQYAECILAGVCKTPLDNASKMRLSYFDDPRYANYPVIYVSWQDAQTFCSWRGGRLPSEAEWEKAARGDEPLDYPWGETPLDCIHANFKPSDACKGDTSPVDNLPAGASPYGVLNMSGNVQEWVSDWFQSYPGGNPNATKEFGITHRVIRGGAYHDGENYIRATTRKGLNPESALSYVGFRCVIDIDALP